MLGYGVVGERKPLAPLSSKNLKFLWGDGAGTHMIGLYTNHPLMSTRVSALSPWSPLSLNTSASDNGVVSLCLTPGHMLQP